MTAEESISNGNRAEKTVEARFSETGQPVPIREEAKPKTCLACGFLTIEGRELSLADRAELGTYCRSDRGVYWQSGQMPGHPERTQCFNHLWVQYDLTYCDYSADGVVDEFERPRDKCDGFFAYKPGYGPEEHRPLQRTPAFFAKEENPPEPLVPLEQPTSPAVKTVPTLNSDPEKSEPKRNLREKDKSRKGHLTLLAGKDRVNFKTAEAYLGIGERHRQQLMKDRVLEVVGKGHNKRITTESLKKYLPPENPQ